MRPYLADLLNRVFGTTVFTYLLPNYLMMLALGAFVGTVYAARRARARGLNPEILYGLIVWALPSALLGGRIMGFLYAPETYGGSLLNLLDPLRGDSAAYGGFIGGVGAGVGYMLLRRVEVWRYLDCAAPALGIAAASTRVGCFLNGCDFGAPTSCVLAVTFPAGSDAHLAQVAAGLIPASAAASLPVHPTQLYLVVGDFALAAIVAWWGRRPGRVPGEEFLGFWMLYAVLRFWLEGFRGDAMRGFLGPFSTSQAVSVVVLGVAGGLLAVRRARGSRERGAATLDPGHSRGALLETVLATAFATLIVRFGIARGGWAAELAPAVWVYVPLAALLARRLSLADHGFSAGAWVRGGRWLAVAAGGILVPFIAVVLAARWLAGSESGWDAARLLTWAALWQLALVAVPEELFFRGYVHGRLRAWAQARHLDATWLPIVAGAVLFAAAHLAVEPGWLRAAVFFPGLVLGWLRERTGGLLAPVGFHWLANLTALGVGLGLG